MSLACPPCNCSYLTAWALNCWTLQGSWLPDRVLPCLVCHSSHGWIPCTLEGVTWWPWYKDHASSAGQNNLTPWKVCVVTLSMLSQLGADKHFGCTLVSHACVSRPSPECDLLSWLLRQQECSLQIFLFCISQELVPRELVPRELVHYSFRDSHKVVVGLWHFALV